MARRKDVQKFTRNSKVVAAIDLPDIPAGTPGKVMIVGGLTWIRYFVQFDMGDDTVIDRSLVRQEWLMGRDDWTKANNETEREAYRVRREAERAVEREAILAARAESTAG